jgi:diguanylate cyclase (GGDEF)-like protein
VPEPPAVGESGRPASADGSTVRTAAELAAALDLLENRRVYDVDGAFDSSTQIEREADSLGATELKLRAQLVRADMVDRRGDVAAGARLGWAVNRWADEHEHRPLLARSHRRLALTYHNLGDPAACLEHAVYAVELLEDTAAPWTRVQHLMALADALSWTGSFAAARERYRQAEEIVAGMGDANLRLRVLNNLAYTEHEAGEPQRAWAAVERMQAVAGATGSDLDAIFLDTIARVQMAIERYAEAEQTMQASLDQYRARGYQEADTLPEILLTLAESQRRQGSVDRAQATLDRCAEICEARSLVGVRVRVQQEQAALYAAQGRYQDAYELHLVFHAAAEAQHSMERDTQARIRHAMLETTEARQAAQRYREQALRDPLTGLHNRRFVDEQLPALLERAVQSGSPLSIALIDLDHFKRINDALSHNTGDQVLVLVSRLLTAALEDPPGHGETGEPPAGFAARMGGEEFLLVLPDTPATDALRRFEGLRMAVAAYHWQPVTGDLPVTVSIGGATIVTPITQSELLARADFNLYAAKRAGRDRVITGHRRY